MKSILRRIARNFFAVLFVAALAMTGGASAKEESAKALSGAEILALLSGNSAEYEDGAKQFFGADGITFYQARGRAKERGAWRADGDRYCSRWGIAGRPSPETCYAMQDKNGVITWDGEYPARIRRGDIFASPAAE